MTIKTGALRSAMSINSSHSSEERRHRLFDKRACQRGSLRQRIMALYRSGNDNGVHVARGEKFFADQ
jgi:hypothetical protein